MVFVQTLIHTSAGSFTATGMYTAESAETKLFEIAQYYRFIYPRCSVWQYVTDENLNTLCVEKFD